ncbi:MAG: M48 family metalloprotease [Planctomycetes bacterium]|nr:M48 family metalloprotease [Planctomycetota bacterium]
MHLIVIIAFAALLWFNSGAPMNKLGLTPGVSVVIVFGEIVLLAAAAMWTSHRTLKTLAQDPSDPDDAQHDHHYYSMILQLVMAGVFVANLILTDWPGVVRSMFGKGPTFGAVDLLVLSPFVVTMIVIWIVQYPVDRAIREVALNPRLSQGHSVHPVWSLRQYLSFNVRYQLMTIAVPMTLIIVGDDIIDHYRKSLREVTGGLIWASDALMGVLVCTVFLAAPVMLRFIWDTEPLPAGELRSNLERIARKTKVKYREILLWHSRGMVVNAAVMGIIPPVRYVLISDGLLESLSDKHIEAVFGHEAGHINSWHIPFFIVFATLTMLIAGGLVEVLRWVARHFSVGWLSFDSIQIIVGLAVVGIWGVAFGWLSHYFEHQADMAGADSITPGPEQCSKPCLMHSEGRHTGSRVLCATAADEFATALKRVAALNGIPVDEKGWRHPSIRDRVKLLNDMSQDPSAVRRFLALIQTVKGVLIVGTLIGLATGLWLYWDFLLPASWFD